MQSTEKIKQKKILKNPKLKSAIIISITEKKKRIHHLLMVYAVEIDSVVLRELQILWILGASIASEFVFDELREMRFVAFFTEVFPHRSEKTSIHRFCCCIRDFHWRAHFFFLALLLPLSLSPKFLSRRNLRILTGLQNWAYLFSLAMYEQVVINGPGLLFLFS